MKPAATSLVLGLLLAATANSQLSLLPQMGFDQTKSSVSVNHGPSFSPRGFSNSFKANLRLDYRFKKGHSPYIGIGTAPGAMAFSFADATNAETTFSSAASALQFRIEGGYQFSSKPINLTKGSKKQESKVITQQAQTRNRCGSSYGREGRYGTHRAAMAKPNDNVNMRLQPSVGLAYLPSVASDLVSNNSGYQYTAGNYKTAVVTGLGLEFGKGEQRLFTLSLVYTKGIGPLAQQSIANVDNEKVPNTILNSKSSSWGMMVGIPISLTKTKKIIPFKTFSPTHHRQHFRSKCGGYYRSSGSAIRKI